MKKVYQSSDPGIDISGYSRDLLPEFFDKVFADGYSFANPIQVTKSGLDITLFYQETHHYVKYRVIKIEGSNTSLDGEHRIRATTANTITIRLKVDITDMPGTANGITTHVASLGYERVYAVGLVKIYKMKHIKGYDLFLKLVYQTFENVNRGIVNLCVGRTYDPETGKITDPLADPRSANLNAHSWAAPILPAAYSYSATPRTQRYSEISSASSKVDMFICGDIYGFMYNAATAGGGNNGNHGVAGVMPIHTALELPLPILIANLNNGSTFSDSYNYAWRSEQYEVCSSIGKSGTGTSGWMTIAPTYNASRYIPTDIDPFNGMSAAPMPIVDSVTGCFLGILRDIYKVSYTGNTAWPVNTLDGTYNACVEENEIENQSPIFYGRTNPNSTMFCIPLDN